VGKDEHRFYELILTDITKRHKECKDTV